MRKRIALASLLIAALPLTGRAAPLVLGELELDRVTAAGIQIEAYGLAAAPAPGASVVYTGAHVFPRYNQGYDVDVGYANAWAGACCDGAFVEAGTDGATDGEVKIYYRQRYERVGEVVNVTKELTVYGDKFSGGKFVLTESYQTTTAYIPAEFRSLTSDPGDLVVESEKLYLAGVTPKSGGYYTTTYSTYGLDDYALARMYVAQAGTPVSLAAMFRNARYRGWR